MARFKCWQKYPSGIYGTDPVEIDVDDGDGICSGVILSIDDMKFLVGNKIYEEKKEKGGGVCLVRKKTIQWLGWIFASGHKTNACKQSEIGTRWSKRRTGYKT